MAFYVMLLLFLYALLYLKDLAILSRSCHYAIGWGGIFPRRVWRVKMCNMKQPLPKDHLEILDAVNVATALHRIAKASKAQRPQLWK